MGNTFSDVRSVQTMEHACQDCLPLPRHVSVTCVMQSYVTVISGMPLLRRYLVACDSHDYGCGGALLCCAARRLRVLSTFRLVRFYRAFLFLQRHCLLWGQPFQLSSAGTQAGCVRVRHLDQVEEWEMECDPVLGRGGCTD